MAEHARWWMSGGAGGGRHPPESTTPNPDEMSRLLRSLLDAGTPVTAVALRALVRGVAAAPFNPQVVRVPTVEREVVYLGQRLGPSAPSLAYHLSKRVAIEEQWAPGTTPQDYLGELHAAVEAPYARIAVYSRRGGALSAFVAVTADVVPPARRGPAWLPLLVVVYSADRGAILTGYQASSIEALGIPEDARWLR